MVAGCGTTQVRFPSLAFDKQTVIGDVFRPKAEGRAPAVVLLHPCGGLAPFVYEWALWFQDKGYGAVVVDSFKPRAQTNVCSSGRNPSMIEVAGDAFGALAYLRGLEWIDGSRVTVMGFSYGAGATLYASRQQAIDATPAGAKGSGPGSRCIRRASSGEWTRSRPS